MPTIDEVLRKLGTGSYGNEVPRTNAIDQAPVLAKAIVNYQKQQRAEPFVQALNQYRDQYANAQTDEDRNYANTLANQARASFVQKGGSPYDLDQKYWGSDPWQGFQTGQQEYAAPYTGDNLTNDQRAKAYDLDSKKLTDLLNTRKTVAAITGYDPDTGKSTWEREYGEGMLANQAANAARSGGSGGIGNITQTDAKNFNTAGWKNQIKIKIDSLYQGDGNDKGWRNAVNHIGDVITYIQEEAPRMAMDGVDPQDMVDYAYQLTGGFKKQDGQWVGNW